MAGNSNTKPTTSKRRLGRGLSGLIKGTDEVPPVRKAEEPATGPAAGRYLSESTPPEGVDSPTPTGAPRQIPLDQIARNPYQPRRDFDESQLRELTQSIRQEGILQPLIVTDAKDPHDDEKRYVLVTGERRLRAAREAGLSSVPCILRQVTDRQMMEWAMIENIQRSDLNPIERARAYRDYMDRFSLRQEQVAERMGQSRAAVANYLRLQDLCNETQGLISSGQISFGHGKVLAGLIGNAEKQVRLGRRIVAEGLSVRKLEELVSQADRKPKTTAAPGKPPYVLDAESRLTEAIGTRVTILPSRAKNTGRIVVEYYSLDDFDRIAKALGVDM
ncbi:MAG TPA: ParB/RepB/Spo0J family partition protein [Phycisphaerae bacterium]|nr:ParB/RepB/Spo0J family partition protein [Phycisphaerae bacterium]